VSLVRKLRTLSIRPDTLTWANPGISPLPSE
jgi:hypothetical protein